MKQGLKAYERLINTCIDEQVDFLLIAGDSFDSDSGSLSAQYRFIRGLENLKRENIPVYMICGNHDPLDNWSEHLNLPDNVVRFSGEEVQQHTVIKGDKSLAEIYGISYQKKEEYRNLAEKFKRKDKSPFAIGMLHGTLTGRHTLSPYCPFDMDSLRKAGMDYWALGHIHKREIVSDQNPAIVYSGNIQGRHFNETGEKGCSLVEVKDGKIQAHNFVPLSEIIFDYRKIDVSGLKNLGDFFTLTDEIKAELEATKSCHLLRIELTGASELNNVFARKSEMEDLVKELNAGNDYHQPFVFYDQIINHTIPVIDLEERMKSSDFIADLLQRFDKYGKDLNALIDLKNELLEEMSSTKVGRQLNSEDFSEELHKELEDLLNSAKWKCMEGLTKQDDTE